MSKHNNAQGWTWFDKPSANSHDAIEAVEDLKVARAFAKCFHGANADMVLAYLRSITLGRALGPQASDATLRHLEGQRGLVQHIEAMIERGRG